MYESLHASTVRLPARSYHYDAQRIFLQHTVVYGARNALEHFKRLRHDPLRATA